MLAQLDLNAIQQKGIPGFIGGRNIGEFFFASNILNYIFGAAGFALLIYLVLGGFQLMTSQGDPKAIQSAQSKITSAVIGFIIVIIAFLLVRLIGRLFGIPGFTAIFGN